MNNPDFEMEPNVEHDRRKGKAPAEEHACGFFHAGLNERLQK